MNKMEKELDLHKLQKKELEGKVMKNKFIPEHYKTKCIEYRYFIFLNFIEFVDFI
jgi:hypothetical protein